LKICQNAPLGGKQVKLVKTEKEARVKTSQDFRLLIHYKQVNLSSNTKKEWKKKAILKS